jgi:hypothetical protein
VSEEIERQPELETAEPGSGPSGQVNTEPGEAPAPRPAFDASAMAKRRWLVGIKSPDLRERAVAALTRVGRVGLRELRRAEAAGKVPPALLSSASKPWEALLDHATEADAAKFARQELEEAKRLVARAQAVKRRA